MWALYRAEQMILEEGFPQWDETRQIDLNPVSRSSLTKLLARAVKPHGLSIHVPEGWVQRRMYEAMVLNKWFPPLPEPAAGLWTGAPLRTQGWDPAEPWERSAPGKWYLPDLPNERHDPEHLQALAEEASRHGVAPDRPRVDPAMHTLLTALVYGRQLVEETEDLDALPPAPGLTPSAHERLARVAPLNRLAVAVLEDAVRPGSLTRDHVTSELSSVVKTYGLVLVEG